MNLVFFHTNQRNRYNFSIESYFYPEHEDSSPCYLTSSKSSNSPSPKLSAELSKLKSLVIKDVTAKSSKNILFQQLRSSIKPSYSEVMAFNAWDRKVDKKNEVYKMALKDAERISAIESHSRKKEVVKGKSF